MDFLEYQNQIKYNYYIKENNIFFSIYLNLIIKKLFKKIFKYIKYK